MNNISLEKDGRVAIVKLERSAALNALNTETLEELTQLSLELDHDPSIGSIIITSSQPKVFCAGADIKEMSQKSHQEMVEEDYFGGWEVFASIRTPKIAAVSGFAFGGGCELAMMCDMIYASETALFGQPEIKLGVIPGIGGTQRLSRLVGKAKAMEMVLTGKSIDAYEAERIGLVVRVIPTDKLLAQVKVVAKQIASYSKQAILTAKELVHLTDQMNLKEGIMYERRLFHSLIGTQDQIEGMNAFIEKRSPNFIH
ncbi:MAG: enoyl-CoA hydratase-related protein [Bacteroidota bacterium]